MIHWPNPRVPLAATLEAMTGLRDEGRSREIGVSNFTSDQFREALDLAPVMVNQVEYHVYLDQSRCWRSAASGAPSFALTGRWGRGRSRATR